MRCDTSVMSRCDSLWTCTWPRLRSRAFSVCESLYVCVPVCDARGIWSWIRNRQNKERRMVTNLEFVTILRSAASHTNNFTNEWALFFPFSFAWQVHYHISTCLHLQIKAEEFPSRGRYPVIWQKWHLLLGHDYTRMTQIMVLHTEHTEINLNGVLSWHSSDMILHLDALNKCGKELLLF